jgi:hypothetical protein
LADWIDGCNLDADAARRVRSPWPPRLEVGLAHRLLDAPLGEAVADAAAQGVHQVLVRVLRVLGLVEPLAAAGALAAVVLERRLELGAPRVDRDQPLVQQDLELVQAVGDAVPGPVGRGPRAEDALELAVGLPVRAAAAGSSRTVASSPRWGSSPPRARIALAAASE